MYQLMILLAAWYADRGFRQKGLWNQNDLRAYHGFLTYIHNLLVKAPEDKTLHPWVQRILIRVTKAVYNRLEDLDILLRIDPLVIGRMRK